MRLCARVCVCACVEGGGGVELGVGVEERGDNNVEETQKRTGRFLHGSCSTPSPHLSILTHANAVDRCRYGS